MTKTTSTLLAAGCALAALSVLAPQGARAQAAHPDFTGIWQVAAYTGALKPADGQPIPFTAEARAAYDQHRAAAAKGDTSWDPVKQCLPEGLPRIMIVNAPFQILQRDKAVYFVAENRVPWKAFFGESLPSEPDPFYMGYSVAKWDGPALVVDSAGFRDLSLLDDQGLPHTEQLRLTATYRLGKDGKTMTATYVITDPGAFTRPWTATVAFAKKPASFQMPEVVCADRLASAGGKG